MAEPNHPAHVTVTLAGSRSHGINRATDRAVLGRRIAAADEDAVDMYRLVIPGAGDPADGAISTDSPLGQAALGARSGTRIEYQTPGGARTVTVTAVTGDEAPF